MTGIDEVADVATFFVNGQALFAERSKHCSFAPILLRPCRRIRVFDAHPMRSVTTITFWSFLGHVCVEWA